MTDRDLELEALRTQVANQAASLAETVTEGFDGFHMGAADYGVELSTPDGPSTGGGKTARQHLRLTPRRQGYAVVVVGTIDPVTSTGEIRTFDHVAILHELRFKGPLEITSQEYEEFLKKVDVVMNLARIRTRRVPPPYDLVAQSKARKKINVAMLIVFLLVMLVAALVVYRVALKVRGAG